MTFLVLARRCQARIWPSAWSSIFKTHTHRRSSDGGDDDTDDPQSLPPFMLPRPPRLPETPNQNCRVVQRYGFAWTDEYSWMTHKPIPPEAYAALEEEASYFESVASKTGISSLASEFERDILSVIQRASHGVKNTPPERVGGYEYYVMQTEDSPYHKYMRTSSSTPEPEPEVVLDVNSLPHQPDGFIGTMKLSYCSRYVAFTASDSSLGEGAGRLMVRDIASQRLYAVNLCSEETRGEDEDDHQPIIDVEWAADGSLLVTTPDALGRPSTVFRVHPKNSKNRQECIYHEPDSAYMVSLQRTKDWKYLAINVHSKLSSEIHVLPASDPLPTNLRCLAPRRPGVEYVMEHYDDKFYLLSNFYDDERRGGKKGIEARTTGNYSLFYMTEQTAASLEPLHWNRINLVVPSGLNIKHILLEDMDVFKDVGLVLYARDASKGGRPMVLVARLCEAHNNSSSSQLQVPLSQIALPHWSRSVSPGANADYDVPLLRLFLSSPVHPGMAIDVDLLPGTCRALVTSQAPLSFPFTVTTFSVPLQDQKECPEESNSIPITYIGGGVNSKSKSNSNSKSGPCLLVVYAAYGHCLPTDFVPERIPLLQRGWTVALVHARGGGELGRRWHAAGRGRRKANSALDVIAAAEHLIRSGLVQKGAFALEANSAGAIAAGGALVSRPDLFGAAVLESPFVDVLTAMSDPSLPLTIHEYDEFADPSDVVPSSTTSHLSAEGLASIAAWCPYHNAYHNASRCKGSQERFSVNNIVHPHVLITCTSSDERVCFVGPLKFAARLRKRWSPGERVLVAPDLHTGHLPSDQDRVAVKSLQYAFLTMAMKEKEKLPL